MRFSASQTDGDFDFEFLNDSNKSLVYVTVENTITLKIYNQTGDLIEIEAGAPLFPPPVGGSLPFSWTLEGCTRRRRSRARFRSRRLMESGPPNMRRAPFRLCGHLPQTRA